MAVNETTPGAVNDGRVSNILSGTLLGPFAQTVTMPKDNPFLTDAIKAVWRNETGNA